MRQYIGLALAVPLACALGGAVRADTSPEAAAIIDKAIKAIGGEEALGKVKTANWKTKGTITFQGSDNPVSTVVTVQGIDHSRNEFEGEFGGNTVKACSVLSGDQGSRMFGGNKSDMDKDALANEKRRNYLTVIPILITPLKDKAFSAEVIPDDKVGDKPAAGIKVTAPDKKDFKLYFDKETGLPVKLVARVMGFQQDEYTEETTYTEYKDMAGIKKATKIESKRDGAKFITQQVTDFKALDKVDPKTFTDPQT